MPRASSAEEDGHSRVSTRPLRITFAEWVARHFRTTSDKTIFAPTMSDNPPAACNATRVRELPDSELGVQLALF